MRLRKQRRNQRSVARHAVLKQGGFQAFPVVRRQQRHVAPQAAVEGTGKGADALTHAHIAHARLAQGDIQPGDETLCQPLPGLRIRLKEHGGSQQRHRYAKTGLKLRVGRQGVAALKNLRHQRPRLREYQIKRRIRPGRPRRHPPAGKACLPAQGGINLTPMKQHNLVLLLALAAGTLTACAETVTTHGQIILPSRLAQIKPGTTTRAEVQQLMGTPSTTGTFNDARWYYVTSTVKTKVLQPNVLQKREIVIVDFDPNGIVSNLSQRTEADAKEVEPVGATTRTHGQSMGVLEQAFGNLGLGQ